MLRSHQINKKVQGREEREGKGREQKKRRKEREEKKEERKEGRRITKYSPAHRKDKKPVFSSENFETNKINPIKAVFSTFPLHRSLSSSW